jgi:hypothetical protein
MIKALVTAKHVLSRGDLRLAGVPEHFIPPP